MATASHILTSSIPGLAVLRAVHGIAFSAFFVANYLYVVDLVPPARRGWALGIFGLSGLISTSLAPLFGEFLVRHWGFGALFAFSTLLAMAATAGAERMRDVRPLALGVGTTVDVFRDSVRELWRLHMGLMFCFGLGTGTIFSCRRSPSTWVCAASDSSIPPMRWPPCSCGWSGDSSSTCAVRAP